MAKYNLVQIVFDREGLAPDEDVAVCTCHIREVVQAAPDVVPVTDQGREDFVTRTVSWWTGIQSHITSQVILRELRFYDIPAVKGEHMGDPVDVHAFGLPGTGTAAPLPPQVALSTTFKTDKRLSWGRFYVPGVNVQTLTGKGNFAPAVCTDFAQAAHYLTSRSGTGAALTVFSRKEWTHHDPQMIQVDDVPDIIRRRRFSHTTTRAQVSAG